MSERGPRSGQAGVGALCHTQVRSQWAVCTWIGGRVPGLPMLRGAGRVLLLLPEFEIGVSALPYSERGYFSQRMNVSKPSWIFMSQADQVSGLSAYLTPPRTAD